MDEYEGNLAEEKRLAKEKAEREANIERLKQELRRQEEGRQRLEEERQRLEAEEARRLGVEAKKETRKIVGSEEALRLQRAFEEQMRKCEKAEKKREKERPHEHMTTVKPATSDGTTAGTSRPSGTGLSIAASQPVPATTSSTDASSIIDAQVNILLEMGFSKSRSIYALYATQTLEEAIEYLLTSDGAGRFFPPPTEELETNQKSSEDETPRKKKKYSEETIRDALKRINNGEKISEVSKSLGIPTSTLSTWKQSDQQKDKVKCINARLETEMDDNMSEVTPDNTLDSFISEIDEYINEGNGIADTNNTDASKQRNEDDNEKRQKKEYSQKIKTEIFQRVRNGERVAALSRHFGIHESTIRSWIKKEGNSPDEKRNAEQNKPTEFANQTGKEQFNQRVNGERTEHPEEITIEIMKRMSTDEVGSPFSENQELETSHKMSEDTTPIKKRKYSKETIRDALKRISNGEKISEVSKDLGIPTSTLSTWKQLDQQKNKVQSFNTTVTTETDDSMSNKGRPDNTPDRPISETDKYVNAGNGFVDTGSSSYTDADKQRNEDKNEKLQKEYSSEIWTKDFLRVRDGEKVAALSRQNAKQLSNYPSYHESGSDYSVRLENPKVNLDSLTGTVQDKPTYFGNQISNEPYNQNEKGKRTEYSQEIKIKVLKRIRNGEKVSVVSRDFGIAESTIRQWRKKEGNATDQRKNADEIGRPIRKTQKVKREDVQKDDLKWKKWQDVMSFKDHGKGWTKRNDAGTGFRFERLGQHFEDKYGLFEIAAFKQSKTPVKSDHVVFVKDGKILTLLERYCKYGFQKSELINDKLREGYDIKARCYYTDSEEEATKQKMLLLEKYDYAWNETKRDDVPDDRLSGDWNGWILVMSPGKKDAEWIKRAGVNFGYRYENLQSWFDDKFGVIEIAISGTETHNNSVVLSDCGKILTCVRNYCTGHTTNSGKINRLLRDGYDILVRCCYTMPGTEKEARKAEAALLARYEYAWHEQRAKRENIKDDHFKVKWTEWIPLMVPENREGWCRRGNNNIGFRLEQIKTAFEEDKFGVFELKTERNGRGEVMYVQHGKVVSLLQRYYSGDCQIAAMLNRALDEQYSVLVRCHYIYSDDGKKEAAKLIRRLLRKFDYSWNKTRREEIDDASISGDWSDWINVLTPRIRHGWVQRYLNDVDKGYRRENFANLFEEKYGIFEIKICSEDSVGKSGTAVYIGKGNILTEVKTRCCLETKQSLHINQALKDDKSLSIRYCYTKSDTLVEATDLERQLLGRYDYAWCRTRREHVYDNDLPGKWSEWEKIMKPGEVEKDWAWRDEKYIGFKIKNIEGLFKDSFGVFEIAIEKPDHDVVVHLGTGKILSELKKYCKINTDGSYKSLPISDSLAKRYNILVRYKEAQSKQDAANIESQLLNRYDYPWNWTNREEVEDIHLPGEFWSNWEMFMSPTDKPGWIRRDSGHTGYRLPDRSLADNIIQNAGGVYEWRIEKHGRSRVVYAGKADSLLQRLTDYCKNGSHKPEKFSTALSFGYSIYVRFRYTELPDEAENELLDRYDYAWNKARNHQQRDVFLPDLMELTRYY